MSINNGKFYSTKELLLKHLRDENDCKLFGTYKLYNLDFNIQVIDNKLINEKIIGKADYYKKILPKMIIDLSFSYYNSVCFNTMCSDDELAHFGAIVDIEYFSNYYLDMKNLNTIIELIKSIIKSINKHFNQSDNMSVLKLNDIIYERLISKNVANPDNIQIVSKLFRIDRESKNEKQLNLFKETNSSSIITNTLYTYPIENLSFIMNTCKEFSFKNFKLYYRDAFDLNTLLKNYIDLYYNFYLNIIYKNKEEEFIEDIYGNKYSLSGVSTVSTYKAQLVSNISSISSLVDKMSEIKCTGQSQCANFKRNSNNKTSKSYDKDKIDASGYKLYCSFKFDSNIIEPITFGFKSKHIDLDCFIYYDSYFNIQLNNTKFLNELILFKNKDMNKLLELIDIGIFNAITKKNRDLKE